MTYDPIPYWQERGRTYEATFRPVRYRAQEAALHSVLVDLGFESVLEVGCGFGRIGALLTRWFPFARYTGIDVSPDMLTSARSRLTQPALVETSLAAYRPGRRFDLVLAVEMLMHVPPAEVQAAVRKLERLSARYVVTVDWTRPVPHPAEHNFIHDYASLFSRTVRAIPVGLQTIHVLEKP